MTVQRWNGSDPVEALARKLCRDDGLDPDATNWMGDPGIPHGTVSWARWQEYADEAKAMLREGGE